MLALGCLIPLVLIAAGAVAGGMIGSGHDAILGAVVGGGLGAVVMAALLWGWDRIRVRRF